LRNARAGSGGGARGASRGCAHHRGSRRALRVSALKACRRMAAGPPVISRPGLKQANRIYDQPAREGVAVALNSMMGGAGTECVAKALASYLRLAQPLHLVGVRPQRPGMGAAPSLISSGSGPQSSTARRSAYFDDGPGKCPQRGVGALRCTGGKDSPREALTISIGLMPCGQGAPYQERPAPERWSGARSAARPWGQCAALWSCRG
jgi:hypothetical protein